MLDSKRKISILIESQLPGFIADEYENLGKFLTAYYEQLELQGQPLDIINNLDTYIDISTYSKDVLIDRDELASAISSTDTQITLLNASSFPEQGGYIRIDQEICFYKKKEGNILTGVTRGVSGNLTIGDLYDETEFVSTNSAPHAVRSVVFNVSNLFLYAIVKSFETQYLNGFPEKYLLEAADKRTLIKNIGDFYRSKGSEKSINFIFNTILARPGEIDNPRTYNPKDYTIKASSSNWTKIYALRVKVLKGNPEDLIGRRIEQTGQSTVFATVDNVRFHKKVNDDLIYELILAEESITGIFDVAAKTCLIESLPSTASTKDPIYVTSTLGWSGDFGNILIGNEIITFSGREFNRFIINNRNASQSYADGTPVYSTTTVKYGNIECLVLGLIYDIPVANGGTLSNVGDRLEITNIEQNRDSKSNNPRQTYWDISKKGSSHSDGLSGVNSALYEDDEFYYYCRGRYGSSELIASNVAFPNVTLTDPYFLRLIRKSPITTTEVYSSGERDIGISLRGDPIMSAKDFEYIEYGPLVDFTITNKGRNYQNPPYVLLDNRAGYARAVLTGNVIGEIIIDKPGSFKKRPVVTITSGRRATARAIVTNGRVTKIEVIQPGEYYTTPPVVRIIDGAGRGRFAEYVAEISNSGRVVGFTAVSEGNFYSQENIQIELVSVGENASAQANIKKWYKERYKKALDSYNGNYYNYDFFDFIPVQSEYVGKGYYLGVHAKKSNPFLSTATHSPLLGWAYDGNPIYGPVGYSVPLDSTSVPVALTSGYRLKSNRVDGPSTTTFPLGSFVEDYTYEYSNSYGKTILDERNGRYCVTPEFPEGTYAYFLSYNPNGTLEPYYPYFVGPNFYSIPVESNYTKDLTSKDLPKKVKRLVTFPGFGDTEYWKDEYKEFFDLGKDTEVIVDSITSGDISSVIVDDSTENFSPGCTIYIEPSEEVDASASVESVKGKQITSLESQTTKAVKIQLTTSAYLFAGDTLTQENTGAFGTILGDVINGTELVLTNSSGTFNNDDLYTSSVLVVNLILNQESSYTAGATLSLTDGGGSQPIGVGTVLDTTIRQNSVRLKVNSGSFFIKEWEQNTEYTNGDYVFYDGNVYKAIVSAQSGTDVTGSAPPTHRFGTVTNGAIDLQYLVRNPYLQSSELIDTVATEIISARSLSSGLVPFSINTNVAVVKTAEDHGLTKGNFVTIDINSPDFTTDTFYNVRRKTFQECILSPRVVKTQIRNSGVGRTDILNGGADYNPGVYSDIELIFLNSAKVRTGVGSGGDAGNARASVIVDNLGYVSEISITTRGYGYKKGDLLTIPPGSLGRTTVSDLPQVIIEVDHAGLAKENTTIEFRDINGVSVDDYFSLNNEIVRIITVDLTNNTATVSRAQNGTIAADHYTNQDIVSYNPTYRFVQGTRLGSGIFDTKVISYDEESKKLLVSFDYLIDETNGNPLSISSTFNDSSIPAKSVSIASVTSPRSKLEFARTNDPNINPNVEYDYTTNPVIELQKYYRYTFNTNHPSMTGYTFFVSPSRNQNIVTIEEIRSAQNVSYVFGYGSSVPSNNFDVKQDLRYLNYFYYVKSNNGKSTDTEGGYLDLIDDPLQGQKQLDYVSNNAFAYLLDKTPQYDGTGTITYTTTSFGAIGKIDKAVITNNGSGYTKLPKVIGVTPAPSREASVRAVYNEAQGTITNVLIDDPGDEYIKPEIVVINGGGSNYKFQILTNNKKIVRVIVVNGGSGYTAPPILRVVESSVSAYATTETIGKPTNFKVIDSGSGYTSDYSLSPRLRSYYKVKIEIPDNTIYGANHPAPVFYKGEKVFQGRYRQNGQQIGSTISATVHDWIAEQRILILKESTSKIQETIDEPNLIIDGTPQQVYADNQIKSSLNPTYLYDVASVEFTDYEYTLKTYYDNAGTYVSDVGRLNVGSQKITDSYFYQDYSYVVKSKKSINEYRELLKGSTHPAGFQMFGEMMIDSEGVNRIKEDAISYKTINIITLYDENTNLVTTSIVKERASQSISNVAVVDTVEERGRGSIQIDDFNLTETIARNITISGNFDGRYQKKTGQKIGTTSFTLIDQANDLPFVPYNQNELIVTLDGVLQEPGISYEISGSTITFTEPPTGASDEERTFEDGSKIIKWVASASVNAGDFVWHTNGIVYLALGSGNLGTVPPTHTTQTAPNGSVNLEYASLTKTPGQRFYARAFRFKNDSFNARYLKKFRNIFQRNGRWLDAANQIEKNKTFIQEETIGYLKEKYPSVNWNTFEQKCYRDIGYIVDGYAKDLRFGGNSYSINNGKLYYDGTVLDHIENELTETLDGFEYAARLCKLAMRNWDYTFDNVTYFQGSDIMVVNDTSNIAIGMYVSAGSSYPQGTTITEIISDTEIRLSNPATGAAGSELINTDTDILQDTTSATTTVGVSATLRVFDPYFYRVQEGGSNQATFYWSGVNSGTYYDAANLILANKENIQREASFAITDVYQLFQYPEQPLEASIAKDARRLLYKNKDFIADYVLEGIDTLFPGYTYGQLVTARQDFRNSVIAILDSLATDLGRDANERMVTLTENYFDDDGNPIGVTGGLDETIFAFQRLIDICNLVITNQGAPGGSLFGFTTLTGRSAYYDLNILSDPSSGDNTSATNCSDVRAAIDTLVNILITPLQQSKLGNPITIAPSNSGNSTWYAKEDKCKRDIGYLVEDVAYHLKFGGNRKIVEFGKFYYEGRTSGISFIGPELQETVYAFNKARDLMILAMRNNIAGDTILNPFINNNIAIDNNSPECASVESSITTMAKIVEDTLLVGKDLYVPTEENENFPGKWSQTVSYSNYNLIEDPLLVTNECDDVSSALSLIYAALESTLKVGKDSAALSLPDYFDGVNTTFELYYEDGSPADLDENERLLITLSGVLQTAKHAPRAPLEDSYYIDRSSVPNKVVFTTPPLWDQNDNVKLVQEALAVDKFSARTIGSYERLTIDKDQITGKTGGPFIMKSVKDGKVKVVGDPKYSLVFVDGVLQEEGKSYIISGPTISFTEPLNKSSTGQYSKVNILLYYGKDTSQTATVFDHELNTYYNKCILNISGAGTYDQFNIWNAGYESIHVVQFYPTNQKYESLGIVRYYKQTSATDWEITLSSQTPKFDASLPILFIPNTYNFTFGGLTIVPTSATLTYTVDIDGNRQMQRDVTKWLYNSGLNDEAWFVKNRLLANIIPGDTIKIDGEEDYRTVVGVPSYVKSRNHLPGSQAWNQYYGTINVSNYDGVKRGEGLSVTCEIDTNTGQVTKLNWDDNSLQLYFDQGLLQNPTAYQYFWTPVLNFISVDGTGGGAEAQVIVSKGQIVDVTLLNPGAGYTKPPVIKVSRGFARIKNNRKIDTFTTIGFENKVAQGMSEFTTSYITVVPPRLIPGVTTVVDIRPAIGFDTNLENIRRITNIVTPDPEEIPLGLDDTFDKAPSNYILRLDKQLNVETSSVLSTISTTRELEEITATSEISRYTDVFGKTFTGIVDNGIETYELDYDGGVLGNRASRIETTKFVGGGVITNGITFEEWDRWFPNMTIEDWSDPIYDTTSQTEDALWNFGYSTETQYMTYVDTTAIPGDGDPGYIATNAVVYVGSTSSFPSSGTIIVGREKISYTGKLSDRFTGVTRGVQGTTAEAHPLLEFVRTINP